MKISSGKHQYIDIDDELHDDFLRLDEDELLDPYDSEDDLYRKKYNKYMLDNEHIYSRSNLGRF